MFTKTTTLARRLLLGAVALTALGGPATASADVGDPPICVWAGGGSFNSIGVELPTGDWASGLRVTIYLMRYDGARWVYAQQSATATWYGQWETPTSTNDLQVYPRYHGYYRITTRVYGSGVDSGFQMSYHYRKSGPGWYATGSSCRY